jgi:hypothetical protein
MKKLSLWAFVFIGLFMISNTGIHPDQQLSGKKYAFLKHIVLFNLKDSLPEVSHDLFLQSMDQLSSIPEVIEFEWGKFADLKDPRALSEYEYIMRMGFENREAYKRYQNDSLHLRIKKKLRPFLAAPPATYDYE